MSSVCLIKMASANKINECSWKELIEYKDKLINQLALVECEIKKRELIHKHKKELSEEIAKLSPDSIHVKKSSTGNISGGGKVLKPKSKPKTKAKSASASDSDEDGSKPTIVASDRKYWTIKDMQSILNKNKIEYKKSQTKDEYIKCIEKNHLVRKMCSLVEDK